VRSARNRLAFRTDGPGVSLPRQLLPGSFYLVTRRCSQRQFLLRPSALTNQVVSYCLALAAEQTRVELHAVSVLSNHYHAVVHDPEARLPVFLELAHKLIAKCQNAALGRWENLWSSDKPSVVRLLSEDDVLEKMAYVIANPSAAGLVKSPHEWPGVITRYLGERRTVQMPEVFFDEDGELPEEVVLEFTRPPIFTDLDDRELNRLLAEAIAKHVRRARESLLRQGKRFLGVKAVLRQAFSAQAKTVEPRRNPNPRLASHCTPLRVQAIVELKRFVAAYRQAWLAWRAGRRDQRFPVGTYALRVHAGVRCEPMVPG
jgi:putative transposase